MGTMSTRRWLKELAASETKTWMNAVAPLGLAGTHRLETRHTVYVFENGVCVDVARRNEDDEVSAELTMIGMRVVGWLLEIEGQRRLLGRWMPGARAVLWRPSSGNAPTRVALTSQSNAFVECSSPPEEQEADETSDYISIPPPPPSGSFTRLFC